MLWYTRRRAIAYDGAALNGVSISGDDVIVAGLVSQTLKRLRLEKRFASINARATALGTARVMALLGGRAVSGSDILTASVIADLEAVIKAIPTKADLPKTDPAPTSTPAPTPTGDSSPKPAPGETPPIIVQPPVLLRPTLLDASVLTAGPSLSRAMAAAPTATLTKKEEAAEAEAAPSLVPAAAALALRAATINPAVAGIAQPASADLAMARSGLNRLALAVSTGNLTALVAANDIVLGDGEVMDVAQDYSDPRLGEGLARLQAQLGESWPSAAQAVWIGESERALLLDSAFRTLAASALPDLAAAIGSAVNAKDVGAIDSALTNGAATS